MKKRPGCSWIEFKKGVHVFITGDRTHPQTDFISVGLNSLTTVLQEQGTLGYIHHRGIIQNRTNLNSFKALSYKYFIQPIMEESKAWQQKFS